MMEKLNEFWEKLTPEQKRYASIGVAALVAVSLAWAFVTGTTPPPSAMPQAGHGTDGNKDITPLVGADIKGLSIERVKGEMQRLQEQQRKQRLEIERLRQELKSAKAKAQDKPKLDEADVRQMIEEELKRAKAIQQVTARKSAATQGEAASDADMVDTGEDSDTRTTAEDRSVQDNPFAKQPPMYQPEPATAAPGTQTPPGAPQANGGRAGGKVAIRTIEPEESDESLQSKAVAAPYLPMGSMITGVFITGMDAGTGKNAQKNPYPALIRVKKDAILPNRFRQDVRECFILASGYGDLSSERVHLRSEGISCIREDGTPIEVHARMIAVGEDGKEGLRGRVVSKQGQLLAKSLMAGVLSGFASAFNQNAVPTINLTATKTTPFQQAFSPQALQSGLVQGTSSALDRLAQFYLDAADQMFPVIEIDAMRRVTFIVEKGFAMDAASQKAGSLPPPQQESGVVSTAR